MSHPGIKLEWGPQEISRLQEMNAALREAILKAPCLAASIGELTYECRHDSLCRVCLWRTNTMREFQEEYGEAL